MTMHPNQPTAVQMRWLVGEAAKVGHTMKHHLVEEDLVVMVCSCGVCTAPAPIEEVALATWAHGQAERIKAARHQVNPTEDPIPVIQWL